MTPITLRAAITHGLRQAFAKPRLLLALWLLNVAVAFPMALVMAGALESSIGASLFHETMRESFDTTWYSVFQAQAQGLAATFKPDVIGIGAVFDNLEAWWSGRLLLKFSGLVALGVAYAVLWAFLSGGVLDRYAHPHAEHSGRRFAANAVHYGGRFLQLAAISLVFYYLVYRLARWLFGCIEKASRDTTAEQPVFYQVLVVVALVVVLLHLVRLVFDYAKIATVVQGQRWSPLALWAGLTFVLERPGRTLAVYGIMGLLSLLLIGLYALVAPGAGQSTLLTVSLAFLLSQLYLATRLGLRLALLGAEVAVFQSARRRGVW